MTRSRTAALLALPALALAALGGTAVATASPAAAETVCDGVTVVVDLTGIDGEVVASCAPGDPASGSEALESAGFEVTTDESGLTCAIDAQPAVPCGPFEGSFWAYWQVVDGDWAFASAGPADTDPAPGDIEGWVYNDGSTPPAYALDGAEEGAGEEAPEATDEATVTTQEATEDGESSASASAEEDCGESCGDEDEGGVNPALWVAFAVVVLGVVVGLVIRHTRSRS